MPSQIENRIIEVRRARAPMKRALQQGGACRVELTGNRRRTLVHHPLLDAPHRPLPWPFSLFQQPTVRYMVTEGETRVSSHIYTRNRVDEAIEYFLRDLAPETRVTISRE